MKTILASLALLASIATIASSPSLVCRDDRRTENGPLRELILTPRDGGYLLQSQFAASLDSPTITIENWADHLACKIDAKTLLTYCSDNDRQVVAQFRERREAYFDSLDENAKRKSDRFTDITVKENGVEKKTISFAASDCQRHSDEM